MKQFYLFLLLVLFSSCEKDYPDLIAPETKTEIENETETIVPEKENIQLKLSADKEANIFDLHSITFFCENKDSYSPFELRQYYDSITWSIENVEGVANILTKNSLTFKWSHCFYLPGKYNTYLHCYKNNKMIYADTLAIKVTNNKDFLMYNWDEVTEDDRFCHGYHYMLTPNACLGTIRNIENNTPSIKLLYVNSTLKSEDKLAEMSKEILYDHICSLYKQPSYDSTTNNLEEKYNDLFSYKEENTEPLAIWLSTKNKIVLLRKQDPFVGNKVFIYAEPRF